MLCSEGKVSGFLKPDTLQCSQFFSRQLNPKKATLGNLLRQWKGDKRLLWFKNATLGRPIWLKRAPMQLKSPKGDPLGNTDFIEFGCHQMHQSIWLQKTECPASCMKPNRVFGLFCFVGNAVALLFCASTVLANQITEKSFATPEYLYNTRQASNFICSKPMYYVILYYKARYYTILINHNSGC